MARRGENIRKRTDGRWEGRYIESYSENGKACYCSIYGASYTEIKEKLRKYKKSRDKTSGNKIELEELCMEWLAMKKDVIKISTYVKYHNFIENHFIPYFTGIKAMHLTSELIQDFVLHQSSLSKKTIHDMLSVLIQIIRYGQSKHYIGYFDFQAISYPKISSQELPVLKDSEVIKLVGYVQTTFDIQKVGVLLSLFMGIRLGELCALQWKDVNFHEETVHISKTMQRLKNLDENADTKTKIVIDAPKSQKSIRDIPIPSFLLELLEEHKRCEEIYVLTGTANYIEPRTYQRLFSRYLNEAGLSEINFHALRHTFATRAVEQGFDIKSLSEILGHSSVKFTMERYVHPSNAYKKMNLEKMKIFY